MFMIAKASDAGVVCVVIAFVALAIFSFIWQFSRSETLLQQWAQENGYRLISSENRWMMRGPFLLTTAKGQTVYRITVEDADGKTREGWARWGSWLGGLFSDKVEVRWDDAEA
jgi:hypothetical protein